MDFLQLLGTALKNSQEGSFEDQANNNPLLSLLSRQRGNNGFQGQTNPLESGPYNTPGIAPTREQFQANQDALSGTEDPRTIEVMGTRPRVQEQPSYTPPVGPQEASNARPPNMDNLSYLLEAARAEEYRNQNAPQRKGVFGTKGTLRNILGVIGDAFLVSGGEDRQYAPQRERERRADAMAGFTANPAAAAERLSYGGFAEDANTINNAGVTNEVNRQQQLTREDAEARAQRTVEDKLYEEGAKRFGQYMGSTDANTYPKVKSILQEIKRRAGLGDEFLIPEQYDPDLAKSYQFGAMPTQMQVSNEIRREALNQKESQFVRAESGRMARDNPPASRAPSRPTAANVDAEILQKVRSGTATPAEQRIYNERLTRSRRGSSGTRREVNPPGKFQGWSSKPK